MRRIFTPVLFGLAAPCLYAQLSAQPETWAVLSGHTLQQADTNEVLLLALEARAAITAGNLARKPNIEASALAARAFDAAGKNDFDAGSRLLTRLMALLQGKTPGEWLDVAGALRFQLDRSICASGAIAHATVSPIYDPGYALRGKYSMRVTLLDSQGVERKALPVKPLEAFEPREFSIATTGLAEGGYRVRFDLLDKEGNSIAHALRNLIINNTAGARVRALQQQLEKIVLAGGAQKSLRHAVAVQSLEYLTNLYLRAEREQVEGLQHATSPLATVLISKQFTAYSTMPLQPAKDLPYAENLAARLTKGESPQESVRGPMRAAYRSTTDQTLQPYRLYLPPGYTAGRKWPLIVAIHPEAGDDGSYFESYPMPNGDSALEHYAAERGYVAVSAYMRGPMGSLMEKSTGDVHELVAEVTRAFAIDPAKIYLLGHMLGGASALELPLDGKTQFAAVACAAGVPLRQLDYAKAPQIPLLFLMGGADTTVAPDEARRLALYLEVRYKKVEYVELEKEDHASIGNAAFPLVFNFFDAVRDGKWKPSGNPIPLPQRR